MITREFKLYLNAGAGVAPVINANQFDQDEEWIFTLLQSDGTVYTPSTGAIIGLKQDGTTILNAGTVNEDGQVVITETEQMTAVPGSNLFEILIDGNSHGTANFVVFVERRPGDIDNPSESDISLFQEAITAAGNITQFEADISALQSGLATTNANLTSEANTRASADATLQSNISAEASTRQTQDAVLQAEIDQIIAPTGEAPSAAEVQNARIGVDGTTYDTLGNAIRTQVSDLKNALSSDTNNICNASLGQYRYTNGNITASDEKYAGLDDYVTIENDKQITVTLFNLSNFGTWYIYQFDSSGTKIGNTITVSGGAVRQTFMPEETAVKIYIFMYRSAGIVLNDNSSIQIEYGYGTATYIPSVTAYDRIARPQAESAKDNLYGGIPHTEKNGYYNADGSISTSHPNGEKYTNKVSVDLYKEIKIVFNFSESKTISYQICTYDSNGDFIERKSTSTTGSHLEVVPTFNNNVKYVAFSYRTYDETAVSLTAYINVPKMWEYLSNVSVSDIQGIKQTSNIGFNSARFKPLYDHLFVSRSGDYVSIPHQSVYHVRLSRLFGFNMIEANVWETGTDGVYIVNHLNGGKFGDYFHHVDGVTDISNINVGDVTWDWISANVRYNSRIVKYRTRPCTLEEFLSECRQQNIIPFITCSDPAVYEIATKYMGEYNFVAYNASRSTCPNGIIYRWSTLTSKDDIVAQCESVGTPYIYGMSNPTAFTDTELKDIVAELHKRGFWIGTSYQDANWYKYSSFGFDFNGAIQQINRIANGNICNFDAVYGFNEYTYTNATEADGILTFTADGSITPNVPDDVTACICGIDIEIVFNGSITIPSKGEFTQPQTYSGDGLLPLFVAIPVINGTPSITLTVASGTVVTDLKFKASIF